MKTIKKAPVKRKERKDNYKVVTDIIIDRLEKGIIPWQDQTLAKYGKPKNFSTMKEYQGGNVHILSMLGYSSPYFLTFNQAKKLDGKCKAGTGVKCVKWDIFNKEEQQKDGTKKETTIPFLKLFTVFNLSQIEGIEEPKEEQEITTNVNTETVAQSIIDNKLFDTKIEVGTYKNSFYDVRKNTIFIQNKEEFTSTDKYYRTAFKLLSQASYQKEYLNKPNFQTSYNKESEEELTTELTAAYLCAHAGIIDDSFENSVSYIQNWITALQENPKWIINASTKATKSAEYILGKSKEFI